MPQYTWLQNRFTYTKDFEAQVVSGMDSQFQIAVNIALQDDWILDPTTFRVNVEANGDEFFHLLMFRKLP